MIVNFLPCNFGCNVGWLRMKSWFRTEPASSNSPGPAGRRENNHGYSTSRSSSLYENPRGRLRVSNGISSTRRSSLTLCGAYNRLPALRAPRSNSTFFNLRRNASRSNVDLAIIRDESYHQAKFLAFARHVLNFNFNFNFKFQIFNLKSSSPAATGASTPQPGESYPKRFGVKRQE